MKHALLEWIEEPNLRKEVPELPIGAEVRVNCRIREGEKERIQAYQGVVIAKHGNPKSTSYSVTVRKMSQGLGVERVFMVHNPNIESVVLLRRGHVRRAKLHYLRKLQGKKARIREKRA